MRDAGPAGRVFAGLAGEHIDEVLDAVQSVADQLLGDGVRPVPPFVRDVMGQCLGPTRTRSRRTPAAVGPPPRPGGVAGS